MNKMILVGIICIILGLSSVGVSFLTQTETNKETVPVEQEVTKTREIPVETQVPKTREVEKTNTVISKENVPVFKERVDETVKFNIQDDPKFAIWTWADYKVKSKDPLQFVIKQPTTSQKEKREWYVSFTGSSSGTSIATHYQTFFDYWNKYPEAYICQYKNFGDKDCEKTQNLDPKEYVIIFDPQKLLNEEMVSRFKSQNVVLTKVWIAIWEKKEGEWVGVPFKSEDINKIPYLEVHLFDHYEMKDVPKTITTKETETYYVTETVMKQETYTEKVTVQKEETKTRQTKPYAIALWLGIILLIIGAVVTGIGFTKKTIPSKENISPPANKIFCPKCGKENSAESTFCTTCGNSLK